MPCNLLRGICRLYDYFKYFFFLIFGQSSAAILFSFIKGKADQISLFCIPAFQILCKLANPLLAILTSVPYLEFNNVFFPSIHNLSPASKSMLQ